jgi:uncharacterized protein
MAPQGRSLKAINYFLAQNRLAMVGVSRKPKSFSMMLFEELCRRGYDVIPVNPHTPNILGRPCFARLQEIKPPVIAALLMTSSSATDQIVLDCAEVGIRQVWMHRATGQGAVSQKAIAFCQEHGIQVVPGECPFMFLPDAGGIHRLHGFVRKITGRYPRPGCA